MIKIHEILIKNNFRHWANFAQISGGMVTLCDGHILLKIPQKYVFGTDLFKESELFYIDLRDWKKEGFYKCNSFTRVDKTLTGKKGETVRVHLTLQTKVNYPPTDTVIPKVFDASFNRVGFGIDKILTIKKITGWEYIDLTFSGDGRALVRHHEYTDVFCLLMPMEIYN